MSTGIYLSLREMWRHRGRFMLFSLVIALITVLVLFVAALSEGLGQGNREYLEKLGADLLVYQDVARLQIQSSNLDRSRLLAIAAVPGVKAVGPVAFSSASIPLPGSAGFLDIALIGIEPGLPGEPPVVSGSQLLKRAADEAIIDRTVALSTGLRVGEQFTIRSLNGAQERLYTLRVAGISDSRKYSLRPSIFVPFVTYVKVRPQAAPVSNQSDLGANIVVVKLIDPAQRDAARRGITSRVPNTEVVDRKTAWESTPGYSAQQSTLNTQRFFSLLVGVLVIGGFFQIQTLQKVPQIGMLKAIGTPNRVIAAAIIVQIFVVTLVGVVIGSVFTLGVALSFPPNIPIVFSPSAVVVSVASIMSIGPAGGLVSVGYSLRVEPLTALRLTP
jgi:putative ABC transport system permease protein